MFRAALLRKLQLIATLFANRPINEGPKAIFDPASIEQMYVRTFHCLYLR